MAPSVSPPLFLAVPGLEAVLLTMQRLVAIAVLLDALETLSRREDYGPRGVFHSDLVRVHERWAGTGVASWLLRRIMATDTFLMTIAGQALAAVVLLLDLGALPTAAGLLLALCGRLIVNLRTTYGMDGSDQMVVIVLSALTIARFGNQVAGVPEACVIFVAAQVMVAYLTAGVAKVVSPTWRSGVAIPAILRTASYGTEAAAIWLIDRDKIARVLCRSIIAMECLLPFAVLSGVPGGWVFVGGGLLFHVGTALLMGLNSFLWSFAATFPAVLYTASLLEAAPPQVGGHIGLAAGVAVAMLIFAGLLAHTLAPTAAPLDNQEDRAPTDASAKLAPVGQVK